MLLTIELPEGIPAPKFKLFDRLEHKGQTVSVVSMTYEAPWSPTFGGWFYQVDPIFPLWQDAGFPDRDDGEFIPEHALSAPKKAPKGHGKGKGLTKVSEVLPDVVDAITAA